MKDIYQLKDLVKLNENYTPVFSEDNWVEGLFRKFTSFIYQYLIFFIMLYFSISVAALIYYPRIF